MRCQQIDGTQAPSCEHLANEQKPHFYLPHNLPPRCVSRKAAANYVDLSASKFDQLVKDGRMPKPKLVDSRKIWDVRALDLAIDALPSEGEVRGSTWEDFV